MARRKLVAWRACRPLAHPLLRRGWLEDRLEWRAGHLLHQMQTQGNELSELLAECDCALASTRPIFNDVDALLERRRADSAAHQTPERSGVQTPVAASGPHLLGDTLDASWQRALDEFLAREEQTCPICMGSLAKSRQQECTLLSCTHVFHTQCIEAFERFAASDGGASAPQCPVCRSEYTRVAIWLPTRHQRARKPECPSPGGCRCEERAGRPVQSPRSQAGSCAS